LHGRLPDLPLEHRYASLPEAFYARVTAVAAPAPRWVIGSDQAARLIGLDPAALDGDETRDILSGRQPLPGARPIAMVYAGHQFGQYVPRLGDGRAILLGQVRAPDGALWDLQLKGAGQTPYSRFGDGRAVLRSCLREFLGCEAMAGLGIPTTRALAVIATGETVLRETAEPGAVMTRLAHSHVRFGHFEYFYYREQFERLGELADHVIEEHFPDLAGAPDRHRRWLEAVSERTAALIASWDAVGFVHGVMNTDNLSVLGETIDYGPFAFMEAFDSDFCPNHTDHGGRYRYDAQAPIGQWNISRLLQACIPLLAESPQAAVEVGTGILERYEPAYRRAYSDAMRAKLGLADEQAGDGALLEGLLARMRVSGADFTNTFRALCSVRREGGDAGFLDQFADRDAAAGWLADYRRRLDAEGRDDDERAAAMRRVNPAYVLRTHLAQDAIAAAGDGDSGPASRLLECLRNPFEDQPGNEDLARPSADDAPVILSCSS
jgi:uncharacterized protein YdiU (UPF0061 family)